MEDLYDPVVYPYTKIHKTHENLYAGYNSSSNKSLFLIYQTILPIN